MTPPVFLTEPGALDHDRVVLGGAEGRHAATVRRISVGEVVDLADGAGNRARCVVTGVGKDTVTCVVEERARDSAPRPPITVVQALPKGDRAELAVEAMTEAGVDTIVPWAAERCVTRWKPERAAKALAKWRSAAREAGKQARRSRIPEVSELASTRGAASLVSGAALGIVLHEDAPERLATLPLPAGIAEDGTGGVVLVVGPEGGLTDRELHAFDEAGATRVLLGPTVLRSSTAGVAALAVLQARCGRW
ncbi:16S rRNA (uracil1498-N3)-methyltransferase [Lipingzhangella halophila]|uniref:Ribosomal RNA small subunit methyltransferase E n=1 Tax=Lipingzhangella halophila TaxID=1783352 RepID=A0A7W7W1G8_9ACTN|nr:16S rRNA (uracil(1498)-N(3))-methyltransferase [Lipingzhangella halophila]MBB4930313.1 16S rRNA (uracil1498-N3)-methyltransferase [Lipingzhangella halophila]